MNELERGGFLAPRDTALVPLHDLLGLVHNDRPPDPLPCHRSTYSAAAIKGRTGPLSGPTPPGPGSTGLPPRRSGRRCGTTVTSTTRCLYGGGACTCDIIEQYGPPSERDDY